VKHLQVKEYLKDTEANNLYNYITQTEDHSIKLNYGGYNQSDKAYDFSLICPNGLYRGNYNDSTLKPDFIIKIV
jgi:hypothetical protein